MYHLIFSIKSGIDGYQSIIRGFLFRIFANYLTKHIFLKKK